MEFDVYDEWATMEVEYIGGLIEQQGLNAVLQTCYEVGREELTEFADERATDIQDFFSTPHIQRERCAEAHGEGGAASVLGVRDAQGKMRFTAD